MNIEFIVLSIITVFFMSVMFYILNETSKERKRLEFYIMKVGNPKIGNLIENLDKPKVLSKTEKLNNKKRKTYGDIVSSSMANKKQLDLVGRSSNLE